MANHYFCVKIKWKGTVTTKMHEMTQKRLASDQLTFVIFRVISWFRFSPVKHC